MTVGERITALLEDYEISMTELAEAIGCNTKQIQRWKKDEAEMGIYKLIAICNYAEVSADYLLGIPYDYRKPR